MDNLIDWLMKPGSLTTVMLLLIFSFIFAIFIDAQIKGKLNWLDLVTRDKSNAISLSKVLQLVGGIVSTWVVVKSTILSDGNISWEIFTAYLAYVGSVEAYGKYITLRNNQGSNYQYDSSQYDNKLNYDQNNKKSTSGGLKSKNPNLTQSNDTPTTNDSTEIERIGGAKTVE